jgi:hypothetical protein
VIEAAVFTNDDDDVLDRRDGAVSVWPAANALPMASWKIAVDTSPVRIARMLVDASCFAVILPPESEFLNPTRSRNRRTKLMPHLYQVNTG